MDEARTISAVDWGEQGAALQQEAPARPGAIRDSLLGPVDPDVARSFTDAQLHELERVLTAPASRRLPLDIRITVPFLWRQYFITFLAGSERRPSERLQEERAKHALWAFCERRLFGLPAGVVHSSRHRPRPHLHLCELTP